MPTRWTRNQKIIAFGVIVSIGTLFVQVRSLGQKIQPVIEMRPQIVNVINNITKVEREIANLNEAIHQQYASVETEVFRKTDLGQRMAVFPEKTDPQAFVMYFQLRKIPEANSVEIKTNIGMSAPAGSYDVSSNIVELHRSGVAAGKAWDAGEFYVVRYIPDAVSDKKIRSVKDVREGN